MNSIGATFKNVDSFSEHITFDFCESFQIYNVNREFLLQKTRDGQLQPFYTYSTIENYDQSLLTWAISTKGNCYINTRNIHTYVRGMPRSKKLVIAKIETFPKGEGVFKNFLETCLSLCNKHDRALVFESVLNEDLFSYLTQHPKFSHIESTLNIHMK